MSNKLYVHNCVWNPEMTAEMLLFCTTNKKQAQEI